MCFIEYELKGKSCELKLHTKIRPLPITCILDDIDPH